jgi:hypothetical protein
MAGGSCACRAKAQLFETIRPLIALAAVKTPPEGTYRARRLQKGRLRSIHGPGSLACAVKPQRPREYTDIQGRRGRCEGKLERKHAKLNRNDLRPVYG